MLQFCAQKRKNKNWLWKIGVALGSRFFDRTDTLPPLLSDLELVELLHRVRSLTPVLAVSLTLSVCDDRKVLGISAQEAQHQEGGHSRCVGQSQGARGFRSLREV